MLIKPLCQVKLTFQDSFIHANSKQVVLSSYLFIRIRISSKKKPAKSRLFHSSDTDLMNQPSNLQMIPLMFLPLQQQPQPNALTQSLHELPDVFYDAHCDTQDPFPQVLIYPQ